MKKNHLELPRCHVGDAIRRFLFGAEGREVMGGCCFEDFQSKRLNLTEPPEDTSQIFTDCSFFFFEMKVESHFWLPGSSTLLGVPTSGCGMY